LITCELVVRAERALDVEEFDDRDGRARLAHGEALLLDAGEELLRGGDPLGVALGVDGLLVLAGHDHHDHHDHDRREHDTGEDLEVAVALLRGSGCGLRFLALGACLLLLVVRGHGAETSRSEGLVRWSAAAEAARVRVRTSCLSGRRFVAPRFGSCDPACVEPRIDAAATDQRNAWTAAMMLSAAVFFEARSTFL